MQSKTLKELAWLHDCVVSSISYNTSIDFERLISLKMRCPTDLGYEPWSGQTLVLTAIDVATSKHILWGVAGAETLDSIRPGVSAVVTDSTMEARRIGVRFPNLEFTIAFHSGSELEIICRDIQVTLTQ